MWRGCFVGWNFEGVDPNIVQLGKINIKTEGGAYINLYKLLNCPNS